MSLYPVVLGAGDAFAGDGLMIAVRLADVAPPLRGGRCWRLMAHRRWLSGGLSGSGRARRRCSARSWRPREISHARRAVTAAVRADRTCYQALTREIAKHRTIVHRNRHRARKSKSPSSFGRATAKDTRARIAPATITMANAPA